MEAIAISTYRTLLSKKSTYALKLCAIGMLSTLGFAPFGMPGILIMSIALLFGQLSSDYAKKKPFLSGLLFGIGAFGTGVTWIYVSMRQFGHMHILIASGITALFVLYLACFPAFTTFVYLKLKRNAAQTTGCKIFNSCLFSSIWVLVEFFRAHCLGGFPWLLVGFSQTDTPLRYLLPIIGVYGVSMLVVFLATCLYYGLSTAIQPPRRATTKLTSSYGWIILLTSILLVPSLLTSYSWTQIHFEEPLPVSVVQANFSIKDKWDESLFWELLNYYQTHIQQNIGRKKVIVLPESAIPLPGHYISDILDAWQEQAASKHTSILFGIPYPTSQEETHYYNTITGLGKAHGMYKKQQLVPFGEFVPNIFIKWLDKLNIPMNNLKSGGKHQTLLRVNQTPVASLICYELAYPELLRQQLPQAQWIVSISDDAWFGHSLAMYQQLQMAQVLSLMTGRYQIVANNDGLSSVINHQGQIVDALPAYKAGNLESIVYKASGSTPWVHWGDAPIILCALFPLVWRILTTKIR